jgi:HEAT repeat protein
VLLIVGNGVALLLERLAYGGRSRAARAALATAIERGAAGPDTRAALARLSRGRALAVLEELAPSLAGSDAVTITAVARDAGILTRAEARCSSRLWRRRMHAVRVLAALHGGEATVPPLLHDSRHEVRAAAAEWAAGHSAEPIVERLVELLADDEPFVRMTAMDSLIRIGRDSSAPLGRALADPSYVAAAAALEVAARIADPRIAEPAAARAGDPDPAVRTWAARLLGALGGDEHVRAVVARLEDPAPEVRAAAAVALGRLGHWPAAPELAAALHDPAWRVRRDAGLALRALGAPGELLLERALRDPDGFTRDMARQTLDLPEAVLPA